ncbi:hypothetical protein E3N88_10175 [Mikania micrantha]|uniref:Uncharacterized protein n=1 Tax=Mikania micrantha TaxID=192012 RepID=A0A5N6PBN8_9ASTR|nr:hypothetical protein E3N88_10175 [Mikania micrantha]
MAEALIVGKNLPEITMVVEWFCAAKREHEPDENVYIRLGQEKGVVILLCAASTHARNRVNSSPLFELHLPHTRHFLRVFWAFQDVYFDPCAIAFQMLSQPASSCNLRLSDHLSTFLFSLYMLS